MPVAAYPHRITFQYLWRELPEMDTDEFESLIEELRARYWGDLTDSNFRGMLEAGLQPHVRREVRARGLV